MNFRIVVGVDGSEAGRRALRWAAGEVAARGGTVQAVTAWSWDGTGTLAPMAATPEEERVRAEKIVFDEVAKVAAEYPAVTIAADVVEGHPARVLTTAAGDADLLALGSHGHSRLHQAVLGSISEECVRKAACPVVVLPVPRPSHVQPAEVAATA